MYKGRRLGSIPSKDDVLGFVERIEFTFDVRVDVAFVGMLDMVMSLGWATSECNEIAFFASVDQLGSGRLVGAGVGGKKERPDK